MVSNRSKVANVYLFSCILFSYDSDVKTSRDTTAIGRGRGRGERGRGAGARGARGGAKNAALVQTSGLFSEGTGEQRLRKSSGMMQYLFSLLCMY